MKASTGAPPTRTTPPEGPAERTSDAYALLRNEIVSGRFHPNERLVEADLARLLGAGRSAVRAALVRLDQEGLVVLEPNRGARVRLVSDREALEIEEVRVILEQMIIRHAAQRVTAADLRDLHRSVGQMQERLREGNPLGYSELNAEFHQRIWSIADHGTAIAPRARGDRGSPRLARPRRGRGRHAPAPQPSGADAAVGDRRSAPSADLAATLIAAAVKSVR